MLSKKVQNNKRYYILLVSKNESKYEIQEYSNLSYISAINKLIKITKYMKNKNIVCITKEKVLNFGEIMYAKIVEGE